MLADRLGHRRGNEKGAWSFEVGGISKELGAWAPSRNVIFPQASLKGRKKGKNQKLK